MPELPEVETTLRAVRPALLGRSFRQVEVLRKNMIKGTPDLAKKIAGATVRDASRHGKYLFLHLDGNRTLVVHLKMSGRLGLRKQNDTPLTYERIRLHLGNEELLIFNDPRTLGRMWVVPTKDLKNDSSIRLLGPDALTASETEFLARLQKKKGILKAVLLDQSFVAGIGNIYADEACFLAGINPLRRTATLKPTEQKALYRAVIRTLEKGVKNMGTSFSDFADLFGKPGQNQKSLAVYGRAGEPCRTCTTVLKSEKVGQRTTVWCPRCQH